MSVLVIKRFDPKDFIDRYLDVTNEDRPALIKSIKDFTSTAEDIVIVAEVFRNIDDCRVFNTILDKSLEKKETSNISFEEWTTIYNQNAWFIHKSRDRLRLRYRTS